MNPTTHAPCPKCGAPVPHNAWAHPCCPKCHHWNAVIDGKCRDCGHVSEPLRGLVLFGCGECNHTWHEPTGPAGARPQSMTEQEKQDRAEFAANVASGKATFRIPEALARILGDGNRDGYADYQAGRPQRSFDEQTDPIFARGYRSGYRMASKGQVPQCIRLSQQDEEADMTLLPPTV